MEEEQNLAKPGHSIKEAALTITIGIAIVLFIALAISWTIIASMKRMRSNVLIVNDIAANGIVASNPNDAAAGLTIIEAETDGLKRGDFINGFGGLVIKGNLASDAYSSIIKRNPTSNPTPKPTEVYPIDEKLYIVVAVYDDEIIISDPNDIISDTARVYVIKLKKANAYSVGDFVNEHGDLVVKGTVAYKAFKITNSID